MPESNHAPIKPEHREAVKMLEQESDRGCVIFSAAMLEDELELLLRAYCRKDSKSMRRVVDPLFRGYAPFSTFSAKIQVSYALGLISETLYEGLELIRKIRNDFAHDKTVVSFQSPGYKEKFRAIVDKCREIGIGIDEFLAHAEKQKLFHSKLLNHRLTFCFCAMAAIERIRVASELIELGLHKPHINAR